MATMLVTCPETAHLERIEYEDTPVGMLITGCTRFSPACALTCERVCAARLDRKRRAAGALPAAEVDDDATTLVSIRI